MRGPDEKCRSSSHAEHTPEVADCPNNARPFHCFWGPQTTGLESHLGQ
jgi:hypothetical protein